MISLIINLMLAISIIANASLLAGSRGEKTGGYVYQHPGGYNVQFNTLEAFCGYGYKVNLLGEGFDWGYECKEGILLDLVDLKRI